MRIAEQSIQFEGLISKTELGNINNYLESHPEDQDIYVQGEYEQLKIKGKQKDLVHSFSLNYKGQFLLFILLKDNKESVKEWKSTRIILPEFAPIEYMNVSSGKRFKVSNEILVEKVLNSVQFAVLKGIPFHPEKKAGILMHISSLPGDFGIGDFGPPAREFIDFLKASGQKYWQILPLSVTDKLRSYSPYSSYSAFAGNTLFIDPYKLISNNLLNSSNLKKYKSSGSKLRFKHAEKAKARILSEAYTNFKSTTDEKLKADFNEFIEKENHWLSDFALFICLKKVFGGKEWIQWPDKYRDRDPKALDEFSKQTKEELESIRFQQFIFSKQWMEIKSYANSSGIEIYGDIPIYIDYDSVDVWSRPELFDLNEDKSMSSVAGVPPDYFNANGQRWGMPLFNWKSMESEGFDWWLQRLKKNMEWFDLVRLDHFRAFSAFWQIPAESETAINGKWVKAPGRKLFDAVRKEFPEMPFVAEDLGEIDLPVYRLRDRYSLPGMKVLQFGFGENLPFEEHNPLNIYYNSIAYTGTHDNNTLIGWFENELDKDAQNRISGFINKNLEKSDFHLDMIRLAYATPAKLVIIPMQDWLGLGENSRMNFPSTTKGNWQWRMKSRSIDKNLIKRIKNLVKTFGRY